MRLNFLTLALLMPPAVLAADAGQIVPASRLVDAAQDLLREHLPSDATFALIGGPEDVRVPAGPVSIKVRPMGGRWPRSRVGVPVDLLVGGRVLRSATVWFSVSVRRKTLAYGEDASNGVMAQAIRMENQDLDVAPLQEAPVESPVALDGMRLRKPVRKDAAVLLSDFEKVPDVDRQETVRVLASYGAIRLSAHGTANAMGYLGDVVPVLIDGADAPVRARVADKGVVEVVQ